VFSDFPARTVFGSRTEKMLFGDCADRNAMAGSLALGLISTAAHPRKG
jgi:hypothetical protein